MAMPRRLKRIYALHDFESAARRHLPKAIFQYVRNGAGEEFSLRRNRRIFDSLLLRPYRLRDVAQRDAGVTLFGHRYAQPFGIAPTGGAAMIRYNADRLEAAAARAANVPYSLSANSITPLEDVIRINPETWFAAYLPDDLAIVDGMVDRVSRAGYKVMIITVDVPVAAQRLAETRAGYTMPIRPRLRVAANVAFYPRWLFGTAGRNFLRLRQPRIANIRPGNGPGLFSRELSAVGGSSGFTWDHIERIRARYPGKLVLKGILRPEDAARAARIGVDGIVVSDHGARLLDHVITPLEAFAEIKAQAGTMAVMVDGGFRQGSDVLTALALGADAVLVGRPFLYASALAGRAGVEHAIGLLGKDIDRGMAMLGVSRIADLTADFVRRV